MTTTIITSIFPTIVRIIPIGSHCLELLSDGSVDIVDSATLGEKEYTHLNPEEARQLFPALVA
jgi:hypothetical protein